VDVPDDTTRAQLAEHHELAEQQHWAALLHAGCRLSLPTLDEQRQRIEKLRAVWDATGRAATGTRRPG
jgi:hypothetical protein